MPPKRTPFVEKGKFIKGVKRAQDRRAAAQATRAAAQLARRTARIANYDAVVQRARDLRQRVGELAGQLGEGAAGAVAAIPGVVAPIAQAAGAAADAVAQEAAGDFGAVGQAVGQVAGAAAQALGQTAAHVGQVAAAAGQAALTGAQEYAATVRRNVGMIPGDIGNMAAAAREMIESPEAAELAGRARAGVAELYNMFIRGLITLDEYHTRMHASYRAHQERRAAEERAVAERAAAEQRRVADEAAQNRRMNAEVTRRLNEARRRDAAFVEARLQMQREAARAQQRAVQYPPGGAGAGGAYARELERQRDAARLPFRPSAAFPGARNVEEQARRARAIQARQQQRRELNLPPPLPGDEEDEEDDGTLFSGFFR